MSLDSTITVFGSVGVALAEGDGEGEALGVDDCDGVGLLVGSGPRTMAKMMVPATITIKTIMAIHGQMIGGLP